MIERASTHPAVLRINAAAVAIVLFSSLIALAAGGDGKPPLGAGRLNATGAATVTGADGLSRTATDLTTLRVGDVVEVLDGTIEIEMPDGSVLEGRATAEGATRLRITEPVELLSGDLLVVTDDGFSVSAGGNRFDLEPDDGEGAARLSRSFAVTAGSYRGEINVDSAGVERTVPALRQLSVTSLGRLPSPRPLQVAGADVWDRRFLGEAIDVGKRLDETGRAYSSTLRIDEGTTPGFYRERLPRLASNADFTDAFFVTQVAALPGGSGESAKPGELLVGGAIAALGQRGSFAQRWEAVFAFRNGDPARTNWGVVALDQGVSPSDLLKEVQAAVERTSFEFAEVAPGTTAPRAPGTTQGPTSTNPPSTGGPISPPSSSSTTSPPTTPLEPPTTEPQGPGVIGGLLETVGELLGGLLLGGR